MPMYDYDLFDARCTQYGEDYDDEQYFFGSDRELAQQYAANYGD